MFNHKTGGFFLHPENCTAEADGGSAGKILRLLELRGHSPAVEQGLILPVQPGHAAVLPYRPVEGKYFIQHQRQLGMRVERRQRPALHRGCLLQSKEVGLGSSGGKTL